MLRTAQAATWLALPTAVLLAVSCSSKQTAPAPDARADIQGFTSHTPAGTVWFTAAGSEGTRIEGEITGLPPDREFALHVHEIGNCAQPEAAGPHFDPLGTARHGQPDASPTSRHAGDLPNIKTDSEGKARIEISSHLLGAGTSEFSVLGRSLVVHSNPDDYTSQPAGDSGERIACGVIQPAAG